MNAEHIDLIVINKTRTICERVNRWSTFKEALEDYEEWSTPKQRIYTLMADGYAVCPKVLQLQFKYKVAIKALFNRGLLTSVRPFQGNILYEQQILSEAKQKDEF